MNKNLLITFGCSMTEGYGLYLDDMPLEKPWLHLDNFHEKGWPNKLAKKLKFDKCLNFGVAGAGISHQCSLFLDSISILEKQYKGWDIHIIFQTAASCRISTYRNGELCQIGKGFGDNEWMNLYSEIQLSSDLPMTDELLYHRPYIESFISICKLKNIKYALFGFDELEYELLKKIVLDNSNFLEVYNIKQEEQSIDGGHPNEIGHQNISNHIFDKLPNSWKNGTSETFEWSYIGESMKLKHNYDKIH